MKKMNNFKNSDQNNNNNNSNQNNLNNLLIGLLREQLIDKNKQNQKIVKIKPSVIQPPTITQIPQLDSDDEVLEQFNHKSNILLMDYTKIGTDYFKITQLIHKYGDNLIEFANEKDKELQTKMQLDKLKTSMCHFYNYFKNSDSQY